MQIFGLKSKILNFQSKINPQSSIYNLQFT
jgi:hypothetical protein